MRVQLHLDIHSHTYSIYTVYIKQHRQPAESRASDEKQMQIAASEAAAAALGRHGAVLPRRRHGDSGVTGDEVTSR